MGIPIQAIGKYLSQGENGFIINDLSIEKIDKKWLPLLDIITKIYQRELGESLMSVYVRGSVARNIAIDNIADLDTFAIIQPAFTNQKIRWQTATFEEETFYSVDQEFPFFNNLEMNIATFDEDFLDSKLAMIVKTQSVLLFGQDIGKELKSYQPKEEMMLNRYWLANDLAAFLVIKENDFELKDCQKIMKTILRSGFELVMKRVGKYSPDLYICYRDFSIFYPKKDKEMYQILDWFLNPILDKPLLNKFVGKFGNWLLRELTFGEKIRKLEALRNENQ